MTAPVMAIPPPEELVNKWLQSLETDDHARGTIRQYKSEHPGDIVGVAPLLEHSSLGTTRIYSQPTIEQLSTQVEQLL